MGETASKREYVRLEGSPFNRGVIHGETLRSEIRDLIGLWKRNLQATTGMPAEHFITKFLQHTDYVSAIKRYTPGLLEEVKGIATGAGAGFDEVFTFQLLDELILNSGDVAAQCSSIGVDRSGRKPALLGQNWDIESYVHGFQTVLHVKDDGSDVESLVFTYAGLLAAFGVNNKGVGICLNSLPILRAAPRGLPVAYVIRGVLASSTSDRALAFIDEVEHASPQNYLIGDPDKVVDVECSSGHVVRRFVTATPGVVFHTNHPLVNDDYDAKYLALLRDRDKGERTDESYHAAVEFLEEDSGTRFATLQKELSGVPAAEITVDRIKAILSSHDSLEHPVCMDLGDETKLASIVSTVMELSEEPRFHVAFGPPDVTPYKTYAFSEGAA
jgi:isopenicillin-N N-acyltransferase-like protein